MMFHVYVALLLMRKEIPLKAGWPCKLTVLLYCIVRCTSPTIDESVDIYVELLSLYDSWVFSPGPRKPLLQHLQLLTG